MRPLIAVLLFAAFHGCAHRQPAATPLRRVLLMGDSQSYRGLGLGLQTKLWNDRRLSVDAVAQSGANSSWYLDGRSGSWGLLWAPFQQNPERRAPAATPVVDELLKRFQPELVLIQLGGNSTDDDPAVTERDARELIRRIRAAGAQCFWIGPPPGWARHRERFRALVPLLDRVARESGCQGFLDARFLKVPESGGDGKHLDTYGPEGERLLQEWIERIVSSL